MSDYGDGFQWTDEVTVVPEQSPIAVYFNPAGAVVIRQSGGYEDDPFIVVQPEYVGAVAEALLRCIGRDMESPADHLPSAFQPPSNHANGDIPAKDPTAAERQRRHRARRNGESDWPRDSNGSVTVPHRDTDLLGSVTDGKAATG
jgi:hypothetical protein